MYEDEEEDVLAPKEPQVDSNDPEERKEARRIRTRRRMEALRKAALPPEEVAAEEELGVVDQSVVDAAAELQMLNLEGQAKVSNVKVIVDEREVLRRNANIEKMKVLLEQIEEEAEETQLAYEEISQNWEAMMKIKDPLDIDVAIGEQKRRCDDLLEAKDVRINYLRDLLKHVDSQYDIDLQKQDDDIKELGNRIEKQLTIMQKAHEKCLNMIEEALNIERENMIDFNQKRWEALYKQRDKEELLHIDQKLEQREEHKANIEKIMWDHLDKYREMKIELETLIQELQKELEKLKATCLINTEKIGYNYQVLKKREEENLFVRSQQKRKLNKMADVANALRAKIKKAAEDGALEELRSEAEIRRLMETMGDLEKKAYQSSRVNNFKFVQVWRMTHARCLELSRELRRAEVALHCHVLAQPPPAPPPPPPKGPLRNNEESVATINTTFADAMKNPEYESGREKLVRHILQLIADNTGFLVEDRLLRLIEKYQPKSRNLCTLDAIFMALEIQAEEDIALLCETFANYAFCAICLAQEEHATEPRCALSGADADPSTVFVQKSRASSLRARGSAMARSTSSSTARGNVAYRLRDLSEDDQLLVLEADEVISKCGNLHDAPMIATADGGGGSAGTRRATTKGVTLAVMTEGASDTEPRNPFLCPKGHNLEIEPMQVLSALCEFIGKFVPPDKQKLYDILDSVKPPDFSTQSRRLKNEEIEEYWATWKNLFSPEKDRLWDGLIAGLEDYLHILQEREKLYEGVVMLRKKNTALRDLVRGMLPEIPSAKPVYRAVSHQGIKHTAVVLPQI